MFLSHDVYDASYFRLVRIYSSTCSDDSVFWNSAASGKAGLHAFYSTEENLLSEGYFDTIKLKIILILNFSLFVFRLTYLGFVLIFVWYFLLIIWWNLKLNW